MTFSSSGRTERLSAFPKKKSLDSILRLETNLGKLAARARAVDADQVETAALNGSVSDNDAPLIRRMAFRVVCRELNSEIRAIYPCVCVSRDGLLLRSSYLDAYHRRIPTDALVQRHA